MVGNSDSKLLDPVQTGASGIRKTHGFSHDVHRIGIQLFVCPVRSPRLEAGFSWSSVAIDLGIHSKIEASNCSARLSVVRGSLTQNVGE